MSNREYILITGVSPPTSPHNWIEIQNNNDTRYHISSKKLNLLGWNQEIAFDEGLNGIRIIERDGR